MCRLQHTQSDTRIPPSQKWQGPLLKCIPLPEGRVGDKYRDHSISLEGRQGKTRLNKWESKFYRSSFTNNVVMLIHTNVGIIQNKNISYITDLSTFTFLRQKWKVMFGQRGMDFYKAFNFCPRAELSTYWPSVNFVLCYRWTVFRLNYTLREHCWQAIHSPE